MMMSTATSFVCIEGDRVRMPASALDHAGFRAWVTSDQFPRGIRATFVDGEVLIEMSPEELECHNKVKTALTIDLGVLARRERLGELYSDGALLTHIGAGLSSEPDLIFISWAAIEAKRVRFVEKANDDERYVEIQGTPDVVIEIVSDSSVRKDLKMLRQAYARAGIPEYWLIDARRKTLRFEILHLDQTRYAPAAAEGEPQPSRIFGRSFHLERTRNQAGRFDYQLVSVA